MLKQSIYINKDMSSMDQINRHVSLKHVDIAFIQHNI